MIHLICLGQSTLLKPSQRVQTVSLALLYYDSPASLPLSSYHDLKFVPTGVSHQIQLPEW